MRPTRFETTVVTTAADGSIVIALFDGEEVPVSLAVLQCSREAAIALRNNLGSALRSRVSRESEERGDEA
jgi:anti-sigma-K factor RskA